MDLPKYAIPDNNLRGPERLLDHFEEVDRPHEPEPQKASNPIHGTAANEPLPPFQSIGILAGKIVEDAVRRRGAQS